VFNASFTKVLLKCSVLFIITSTRIKVYLTIKYSNTYVDAGSHLETWIP